MKRALIPATLVLTAMLAPCVSALVGWNASNLSATNLLTGLFWELVDTIREKEINRLISVAPANGMPAATPESTLATVAPIAVSFVLGHVLPAAGDPPVKDTCGTVSISACTVRRIVEREFKAIREEAAGHLPSRPDHNKEKAS